MTTSNDSILQGVGRDRRKTALIVDGGVMRGAWAAGVLSALRENGHDQFDMARW